MFKQLVIAAIVVLASVDQTEAVRMKTEQREKMVQSAENKAEWGFLKNIVNIDRFFDSGVKA